MYLKGKDLIIMADGAALAAAKSCDIEVDCETIPIASTTSGAWTDAIVGRKSWKVATNHLVMAPAAMFLKVGQIVTLRMTVADADPLPFDGYVDNVTITQSSLITTSSSKIYWDTTRKKFVIWDGSLQTPKYYLMWQGGAEYMNPEMRLFYYDGDTYTVANGNLVGTVLHGSAICERARVTGNVGSLAQGGFSWLGKGALSTPSST